MPELESITIKGFKSIAALENLRLGPINVLIGPNGSGKSNFIGVFSFLHAIRKGQLQDYVARAGGADRILHFGARATPVMEFTLSFRGPIKEIERYAVRLSATADDRLYVSEESVDFWEWQDGKETPRFTRERLPASGNEAGVSDPITQPLARPAHDYLGRLRVHHYHDTSANSPMKKMGDVHDNRFLRPDGSNLAAFLYLLRQRHETSYDLIRRTVMQVAPFFEDFALAPLQLNPDKIRLEWRHKGSDAYFDAASLSDGTLRFIALATLFLQPETLRPSVILVDEPELGLHPYAITLLAALIRQASIRTQVIVSTQSSLLLDQFEPEDVLVADRVNGGTRLTRLERAPLEAWLEDYSLGQLWEKGEFGGRPAAEVVRG